MLRFFITFITSCLIFSMLSGCAQTEDKRLIVGAEQPQLYLQRLKHKKVGLVVNQTSLVHQQHLVDFLLSKDIHIHRIFAPEHGFRGNHDAGAIIDNSRDVKTGIEIYSIYGKQKKPSSEAVQDLDIILFDIQDVGVRFYTYISSMHYVMEAAAENGVEFMVLDRPNPNGDYIDGPLLNTQFQSFVGMHPIPLVHGLTVAELALMIKGENWINQANSLKLDVVPVAGYKRDIPYSLPIKPSPNLPNDHSIRLYPSLAFFEATPVSIGRGTDFPFQVIGHDQCFNTQGTEVFVFQPRSIPGASANPKFKDIWVKGMDLRSVSVDGLSLYWLLNWYQAFSANPTCGEFFKHATFFDKLAGTDQLRKAIIAGKTAREIRDSWQADIVKFKSKRTPYLIYQE